MQVNRREESLVAQPAVEVDFRVTSTLEFFENHIIHARTRINKGGGDNGQRAAFLDVSRCAKEPLGTLQGVGVDTARKNLAARGHNRVMSASQTSN